VSCIIAEKYLDDAARAIHAEFFGQAVTSESEEGGARRRPTKKAAAKSAARRRARA